MLFTLQFAVRSLRDRSIRSWLTISGVIVSIAVILTLLTLSSSLQGAVVELFEQFGTDRIQIAPAGGVTGGTDTPVQLLEKDVETVESLPYFDLVLPMLVDTSTQVSYRNRDVRIVVAGIDTSQAGLTDEAYGFGDEMVLGRYFRDDERSAVVLGHNVAFDTERYFGIEVPLRSRIGIGNRTFEVVGVLREYGTPDDDTVMIPLDDARIVFGEPNAVSYIAADVQPGLEVSEVSDRTLQLLERRKGEDSVVVLTPQSIIAQFNQITGIIQGVLLGIASISLVVGALGIANTMFTSVLEREREIGILKAVGASNQRVLSLFMIESGLIGLLGGTIGVILGVLMSLLVGEIAAASGFSLLSIRFDPWHIIFALVFSAIVGVLSGLLPSYIASRKRIVDALRSV